MTVAVGDPAPVPRRRRLGRLLGRRLGLGLLGALLVYGAAVLFGLQPSVPFDVVLNLGSFAHDQELDAGRAADGPAAERLVVLQHGLWRSPWALWKLEGALRAHGYQVLNPAYPSTRGTIEQHAERLHRAIEARWARPAPGGRELFFVGHSMGGLVIHEYLRRPDARPPSACVFLATPHRGAVLADLRKRWWVFELFMGSKAAGQLSPGDPLHDKPIAGPCPMGTVVGAKGDGEGKNADIPGDDDGTVGEREAHLTGEADSVTLPVGHTRITIDDRAIGEVLHFLRYGRFRR